MAKAIVLGAGLSGIAASKLLIKKDVEVLLFDNSPEISVDVIKKSIYGKTKFKVVLENISDEELQDISLCVLSPGFPKVNMVYQRIKKKRIPIISEIELGYLYSEGDMCAITGSNGKTTTVELTGSILRKAYGEKVNVVGNVGIPYSEKVLAEKKNSKYVLIKLLKDSA